MACGDQWVKLYCRGCDRETAHIVLPWHPQPCYPNVCATYYQCGECGMTAGEVTREYEIAAQPFFRYDIHAS